MKKPMARLFCSFFIILFFALIFSASAATATHREKQFENKNVAVWKTIIEPQQALVMHRHDRPRIIVALTDVDLTIKNDHGQSHTLVMKKGTARFLFPDPPKELHYDMNNLKYPAEVMVIEFKK